VELVTMATPSSARCRHCTSKNPTTYATVVLGNGVKTLLENSVTRIDAETVEEVLRHDPPLHMFTRWVYEDVTLFGHGFRRGLPPMLTRPVLIPPAPARPMRALAAASISVSVLLWPGLNFWSRCAPSLAAVPACDWRRRPVTATSTISTASKGCW
jgi:hypothetical protein